MLKPVVKVIPAQDAVVHFRNASTSDATFNKARRFATGDFPKLGENHIEITHTATIQVPYTMRALFQDNGKGISGSLRSALKSGTEIRHSALMNQVNPRGYLCDAYVDMGGMTGPCNILFAVDAINRTNIMVLKSHHKTNAGANIDRLMQISKSGEASQWNAQAASISSFRNPNTGQLLSTQLLAKGDEETGNSPAASSSTATMADDEQALLEMQEMVGRMCVADGVEFPVPKYIFQGKSTLRHTYDIFGAVNPKTLDVCAYKAKRNDDYTYVLAHSAVGMAILGSECVLAYQGKEKVLPTDELGYVLKVPNHVFDTARHSVLTKAERWENMAACAVEDMHVRIRPGVLNWTLSECGQYFERDGVRVDADEQFTFTARVNFTQRHYHSEECAAILTQFKDVWPQAVFNSRDVNFKTGEVRKDARSMVHLLTQNIQQSEDQLELYANLADEKVIEALKKANVDIDEDGNAVPLPNASAASSSDTSAAEDD